MIYPVSPEPHTLEVEVTNHCSASCTFCPHPRMERAKGFIDVDLFNAFLGDVHCERKNFWLNRVTNTLRFPKVVFAGLGEPTLHRRLPDLVALCSKRRFLSQVITNGAHLTPRLVHSLVDAGLTGMAISLHSLNAEIYNRIMHLDLGQTLPRIVSALELLGNSGIDVEIWRVLPPKGMRRDSEDDHETFNQFVRRFPFVTVRGPSEPWSRDGTVDSVLPLVTDQSTCGIWCHNLYFTCNIAWDGTAVMCCVDFHRKTVPLGNAFTEGFLAVQRRRVEIFRSDTRPEICRTCRKWADTTYPEIYEALLKPKLA